MSNEKLYVYWSITDNFKKGIKKQLIRNTNVLTLVTN